MTKTWTSLALAFGLVALIGCGGTPTTKPGPKDDKKDAAKKDDDPKHASWWCDEHGIPEHECSMCSEAVKKKLKPDEFCPKHADRAKDQCFICHPDLWPQYVAKYKAKYGQDKEPPEPENNLPGGKPLKKDK